MKPTEYYNYPRRRRKLWWLPLALVLLLVFFWAILRGCGVDVPAPGLGGSTEPTENGAYSHTVLIGGRLYNVLEREYDGDLDLQTVYFIHEPRVDNMDGENLVPVEDGVSVPEGFSCQRVMDGAEYEAFCQSWGLKPAFPGHDGRYAVIARAADKAAAVEVQAGDVRIAGETVTVLLRDRFRGEAADALGFVLTIPVPDAVRSLKTEPLYSEEEIGQLR